MNKFNIGDGRQRETDETCERKAAMNVTFHFNSNLFMYSTIVVDFPLICSISSVSEIQWGFYPN